MTAPGSRRPEDHATSLPAAATDELPSWLRALASAAPQMRVPPPLRPPAGTGRPAAVLVLFGQSAEGEPDLLFVQRSAGLRKHPGQPAFPGGAIDPADGGPVHAALREAAEETGLDPAGVQVVAVLPELYIARSDFRVTPVLGWWQTPCAVAPGDPGEIAAVARIPVAELVAPANRLSIRYPAGQHGVAFRAGGMLVWGFTAMLVDRLLALGGWEQPWDAGRLTELPLDALSADPSRARSAVDGDELA